MLDNVEIKLKKIEELLKNEIFKCKKPHDFLLLKSKFLGSESEIKKLLKELANSTIEIKKQYGKILQNSCLKIENEITQAENSLKEIAEEKIDPFLPIGFIKGSQHIITKTINEIKNIFFQMGFEFIEAPEIETEFRNFTALNIDEKHPCREDHQSFFLNNNQILRTQTSNMQTYVIEKKKNNFKTFTIGRTFRRDLDATHTPMFHQIEGFVCSEKANVRELFKTLKTLLSVFFEIKNPEIRVRPSFFPFTEPSYEIDFKWKGNWLEILGAGITHPNLFTLMNEKPQLAYAFGCGVERFAMIKYNISDIREIYTSNAFIANNLVINNIQIGGK